MTRIAAEALIERLVGEVDDLWPPGDGINGIMEGLRRHSDRIKFILVHHEEAAAFVASRYAKATGRVGCVWPPPDRADPSGQQAI